MKFWLGTSFWAVSAVLLIVGFGRATSVQPGVAGEAERHFLFAPSTHDMSVIDPTGWLRVGDSVFLFDSQNVPHQVGHVVTTEPLPNADPSSTTPPARIELELYGLPSTPSAYEYEFHYASGRLDDLFATLVPEEKRKVLMQRISEAMQQHGEAISESMLPIVIDSFRRSIPALESGLRQSLARHESDIQTLLTRYRSDIIDQRLTPLIQDEVIPILRKHGQEPAEAIGQEIWSKAPLFQLGWKAVYDQSPLPKRDMLQEEFDRFVDEEVIPIVQSHMKEIVHAVEMSLADLAKNPRIRAEFAAAASQIANDPEFRRLLRVILTEAVVDNTELRTIWKESWSTPQAKLALKEAGARIQPVLREIADEVMGTREDGIEPGFARILRNQILGKDRSWITLHPLETPTNAPETPTLVVRQKYEPYPIVRLARP